MGWGSMSATQTKGHLDVLLMRCLLQPSCTKCSKEKTPQSWWRVQDWIVFLSDSCVCPSLQFLLLQQT